MTPAVSSEDAMLGWVIAIALAGLAALWLADLLSRPRLRPHADDTPAPRNLDDDLEAGR